MCPGGRGPANCCTWEKGIKQWCPAHLLTDSVSWLTVEVLHGLNGHKTLLAELLATKVHDSVRIDLVLWWESKVQVGVNKSIDRGVNHGSSGHVGTAHAAMEPMWLTIALCRKTRWNIQEWYQFTLGFWVSVGCICFDGALLSRHWLHSYCSSVRSHGYLYVQSHVPHQTDK